MTKYSRVTRQEFPSTDPARVGQMDVLYVYQDELFQTVSLRFPLEEDSAERVREELRKREQQLQAGGPREIEV